MKRIGKSLVAVAIAAAAAAPARAQTDNRFAIGAEFTIRASDHASTEDAARHALGPGLLWRFGNGKPGWGFHWGLNWYAVDIDRPIGGTMTPLGELHVRPFMAGYGYTYKIRKYSVASALLGGYAIGSIGAATADAAAAYQNRLGARIIDSEASNTFVLKPEIGVWREINKKLGVNVNAGYMIARPDVTITTSTGVDKRTARADQFVLKAGVVYSIF